MITITELLKNLAEDLKMDFQEDPTGTYSYQINDQLLLQIELSKNENELVIGSFFIDLPPGKFRENILAHALIANYILNEPSFFAFSEKKAELLLYQLIQLNNLNSQTLQEHLNRFTSKALAWQEAIKNNQAAPRELLLAIKELKS